MIDVLVLLSSFVKKRPSVTSILIMFTLFLPIMVKSPQAAELPSISVFYCSSDEIPFIGELIPVITILENDKVKAELGLSAIQIDRLKEEDKSFSAGIKNFITRQNGSDNASDKGSKTSVEYIKSAAFMIEDARKRTSEVLKPHQLTRMKEIVLQRAGILSIPKREIQQLLHLERKQERALDEIRSRLFKKIDDITPQNHVMAAGNACKFVSPERGKLAAFIAESEKSAYRLLTSEQKDTIEKLKGKPFAFE
jgi:hypothetical protein